MLAGLSQGVVRIDLESVNAYLVNDDGALTLVDAGSPGDAGLVAGSLLDAGYDLGDVERVLVTHYDPAHVGALADLAERGLTAPVHMADPDAGLLTGESRPRWWTRKGLLHALSRPFVHAPESEVRRVADGDRVGGFVARHTPGHTPGHVAWLHERLGAAFVGDLLRERGGRLHLAGRLASANPGEAAASARALLPELRDCSVVGVGHGRPVAGEHVERIGGA